MSRIKYKNRLDLPLPIVEAVMNDPYTAGDSDYTATSLLQPPRMRRLVQLHPEETIEDVADVLYRLHGQAVHLILERAASRLEAEGYVVEKRFYATFPYASRIYKISAQVDIFDPAKALLQDYKASSVHALAKGLKDEHFWQVNLQAYLLHKAGFPVERAEVVGLFRDWQPERAEHDPSYPQEPAVKQNVRLLLPQQVEAWVVQRIAVQEKARAATQQTELAECTDQDTWAREDVWAVMKDGNSRASVLCGSAAQAEDYCLARPTESFRVERRYGKAVRCARYCPARTVCEQWKNSPRNPANSSQGQGTKQGNVTRLPAPRRKRVAVPEGFEEM